MSLADNKQLLGLRYAEWCSSAPTLEADIAAAAMGLDDLGHSRVLYGCVGDLDPALAAGRESDAAAYFNVPLLDASWTEWGQFVAANAVLDTAFTLMIEALADGTVELLRTRLRKMLQEERYHFLHGRSWLREKPAPAAVERAWQAAWEFFGPESGDVESLHREGQLSLGLAELRRSLEEKLERSTPSLTIDWQRWDPIRRRSRPGGIDQRTFEMLRGLEERRYMPAGGERKKA